jgi:hypothetical protein
MLHRRGVEVTSAELVSTAAELIFRATFLGTDQQARTVRLSFGNLVDVLHVDVDSTATPPEVSRPAR